MILTYHEIGPSESAYRYAATVNQLAGHLRFLDEHNARDKQADPRQITFDDGHASHYKYALPVLQQYGRRAIFFITVQRAGVAANAMTWSELKEMASLGHAIESHTWSHKFLTACSEPEVWEEIERSKLTLEDRLGQRVEAISMPGGRCNRQVLNACEAAGYRRIFDSNPWRNMRHGGLEVLGRFMVDRTMDNRGLERMLNARGIPLLKARGRRACIAGAKVLLGDRLYHRLWCAASAEHERQPMDAEYS
jgi:peptidoglycan/xylan/chitin deacetylase (PgdA/CDA1 family)